MAFGCVKAGFAAGPDLEARARAIAELRRRRFNQPARVQFDSEPAPKRRRQHRRLRFDLARIIDLLPIASPAARVIRARRRPPMRRRFDDSLDSAGRLSAPAVCQRDFQHVARRRARRHHGLSLETADAERPERHRFDFYHWHGQFDRRGASGRHGAESKSRRMRNYSRSAGARALAIRWRPAAAAFYNRRWRSRRAIALSTIALQETTLA